MREVDEGKLSGLPYRVVTKSVRHVYVGLPPDHALHGCDATRIGKALGISGLALYTGYIPEFNEPGTWWIAYQEVENLTATGAEATIRRWCSTLAAAYRKLSKGSAL